MNARADIDLVLPCYNPPSGWEEQVATHFREVERLFSPVRFHLFIVSDTLFIQTTIFHIQTTHSAGWSRRC